MEIEELLRNAEAEYENAIDDLYWGYGYQFWRTHFDNELNDEEAQLVWKLAKWTISDEYMGCIGCYPTLRIAYDWYTHGVPKHLDPNTALDVYKEAYDIIDNFKAKAVRVGEDDPFSVLVKDEHSGLEFWVDSWVDEDRHDIMCDWNQDIFYLDDANHVLRKLIQEDSDVFDEVSCAASEYQKELRIVHQWSDGSWHTTQESK